MGIAWCIILFHDQDTIHAGKRRAEMQDFCMGVLMFRTGQGIKVRTHAYAEIAHFPTWCITGTWKALGLRPCASQAMVIHLVEKCVISTWTWVFAKLAIFATDTRVSLPRV